MRVLITNDDGISSPWLADLAVAFESSGHDVTVVAPAADCSGMSGALAPLPLGGESHVDLRRRHDLPVEAAWGADGCSPSLCVVIGLSGLCDGGADLVVSGVNHGWNVGRDIWRSGTVWAAVTAWGMDVPALAVSAAPTRYPEQDRRDIAERTVNVGKRLVEADEPQVWNLNFPAPPAAAWRDPVWVSTATHERLVEAQVSVVSRDANGDAVVRLSQQHGLEVRGVDGTDAAVVLAGGITLSRLRSVEAIAHDPPDSV